MKYLIIANGPFLPTQQLLDLRQDHRVVALDGAADKLKQVGIKPDVVLGDFDSIEGEPTRHYPGATIVHTPDQALTDLMKGVQYCDANGATHIDIACAIGGRLDHTLTNLRTLRREYKPNRPLVIYTETEMMTFAKDEEVTIEGEVGDQCAVMAFPTGSFTSTGLRYNAPSEGFPLEFAFLESSCNQLAETNAIIRITGEALIIHPLKVNL